MRRIFTLVAMALTAALLLVPAAVQAHGAHHRSSANARADRNHDGIPDRWERRYRLSLRVKQTRRDPDHDGLTNLREFRSNTNPRNADTDHDGVRDGAEGSHGLNPRNRDSDGDGVVDGQEHAGKVHSFDGTTLVIDLAQGGQVTGTVVAGRTQIECKTARPTTTTTTTARSSRDGGDSEHGDGDSQGTSGTPSGDDHNESEGDNNDGDHQDGDHEGDENDENGEAACSSADLQPDTIVHEAELSIGSGGPVFTEVELVKPATP